MGRDTRWGCELVIQIGQALASWQTYSKAGVTVLLRLVVGVVLAADAGGVNIAVGAIQGGGAEENGEVLRGGRRGC